jgi:hypothetical protein
MDRKQNNRDRLAETGVQGLQSAMSLRAHLVFECFFNALVEAEIDGCKCTTLTRLPSELAHSFLTPAWAIKEGHQSAKKVVTNW